MTRITLFTATLVQDSALSVSGIDREGSADQPFTLVDGVPTLSGRGLKGAVVAMARRFFDPLPRSISEDASRTTAFRRSAWEFSNIRPDPGSTVPLPLRAGIGIRQKTAARAYGVLYDREVVPAGTRWPLHLRVDWQYATSEAEEAEGILGYVLTEHWAHGRCWLGGDVARGLGWCHIENLRAWRMDETAYESWVRLGRHDKALPVPLDQIPSVGPTRSWCFRTLDLRVSFGEYRPDPKGPAWGLDMLAIGPHATERTVQATGKGRWAVPSWTEPNDPAPEVIVTDRAVLLEGDRPLLPGSSVRGPMRHLFSSLINADGGRVHDPHLVQGKVAEDDPAGKVFGTVSRSSRILIHDAHAEDGWVAARLHMHAEDEFSAGSYGSAKRDAVRLLRAEFPVRIVVEGPDEATVKPLMEEVDRIIAHGALGHLPIGGHKTRGAGWGHWTSAGWHGNNVVKARNWQPPSEDGVTSPEISRPPTNVSASVEWRERPPETVWIRVTNGVLDGPELTRGEAAGHARAALKGPLVAWWCEPTIDLSLVEAPATFGRQWPDGDVLRVDEVVFFAVGSCWRTAGTASGIRWVLVEEVAPSTPEARQATVLRIPAHFHGNNRFARAAALERGRVILREWHVRDEVIGFTMEEETP